MEPSWHYHDNGANVGPLSTQDIVRRIQAASDQPHYVWTEGMSEWSDARTMPQFTVAAAGEKKSLLQRARHELVSYLSISAYLLVWFSALLFYKSTILGTVGIPFAPFGFAAVKALVLGKFMLMLEMFKIGERRGKSAALAVQIVVKALIFTVILVLLSILEHIVSGYFHGETIKEALGEVGGGSFAQLMATAILMFLVLLPYLAYQRLARAYGDIGEVLMKRGALEARHE